MLIINTDDAKGATHRSESKAIKQTAGFGGVQYGGGAKGNPSFTQFYIRVF